MLGESFKALTWFGCEMLSYSNYTVSYATRFAVGVTI